MNTNRTDIHKAFLQLVRLGLGTEKDSCFSRLAGSNERPEVERKFQGPIDWSAIRTLAEQQGLYAIVLDGIEKLPASVRPPQEMLLEWIGEVLQGYEYRFEQYEGAISNLAGFYNSQGFKMMVLKGYACALNWPKPSHRPCGDIDIWQFGRQKEADEALIKTNTNLTDRTNSITIDKSHHHHTVFEWGEFTVENHYDLINIHHLKGNIELEKIFKDLGQDDNHYVEVKSASTSSATKVYLPSPNLHALFLLKHMIAHFVGERITLRQLLDWAFFMKNHGKEVDWKWLESVMNKFGMTTIFNIFNAICVEDLGFKADIFPLVQFNPSVKDRVFNEILEPEFSEEQPKSLIPRISYKFRRWYANGWKHDLCYKESRWSAFWNGIWNHMLKPASI